MDPRVFHVISGLKISVAVGDHGVDCGCPIQILAHLLLSRARAGLWFVQWMPLFLI